MSILIPEERILVREALPALGQLAAFLFIIGCIYVIDGFVRALFGTITGAVGWIPYAGKVLRAPVHRIGQKVTHALGTAEEAFDRRIGTSFHKLAAIARRLPGELLDLAKLILGVTILLGYLPTKRLVHFLIRTATRPLHAAIVKLDRLYHGLRAKVTALAHFVTHTLWHRLQAIAHTLDHVITHDLPYLRQGERALERELARLRRWVRGRALVLTTGAFIGALVWAMGKLGISWIRCANWKRVGREVCRMSPNRITALLSLLAGALELANLRDLARFAESIEDEVARGVSDLVGISAHSGERFTID